MNALRFRIVFSPVRIAHKPSGPRLFSPLSERVSRRALLCSFFFKNGLEQPRQSAPHDIGPQLAASDRFSELPVFYRTGVMIMS
jgi:hypothetical protein